MHPKRNTLRLASLVATLLLTRAPARVAEAADQTVLGKRLTVRNPDPANPLRRRVTASAIAPQSPATIVGDPTLPLGTGGGVLELVANGTDPTSQVFGLAQGLARNGRPFWRAQPSGYRYDDPKGEQGPVRSIVVRKDESGTFRVRADLHGKAGGLDVAPPDPGTDGLVALSLSFGDRYCVQYGPEGAQLNDGQREWAVRKVVEEGCSSPPQPTGEFLALSYNVAGLPEGLSGSHPEHNTPIISPLLNGYELVVVQESWQTPDPNPLDPIRVYHELLVADADHPYETVSAPLPLGHDPRRPSAFVSDGLNMLSRFPFTSLTREMWADCWTSAADCLSLKGFMATRTTFAPGVTVDVYTLHMEAGGDPEDDALRDQAVSQLSAFLATYSAGRPVIVGGDFNLHTDTEPDASQFQRLLAETGLTDVCAALVCPEPGRIDKFLFRSGGGVEIAPLSWRFETDVFVTPEGDPLSDHDALAVRFRWTVSD